MSSLNGDSSSSLIIFYHQTTWQICSKAPELQSLRTVFLSAFLPVKMPQWYGFRSLPHLLQNKRNQSCNKGKRSHQNRSETGFGAFYGSFENRISCLTSFHGKFYNKYCVLPSNPIIMINPTCIDVIFKSHCF